MNNNFICDCCGELHHAEQCQLVQGNQLCSTCAATETITCSRCGEVIYRDNNAGDEDTPLCQVCFDRYYTTCERCNRVISTNDAYYAGDDDDEPHCDECYTHCDHNCAIHDYYYKPEPLFRGDGKRFFGVELEIDVGGERSDHASSMINIGNSNGLENIYAKHDGSLDNGIEIVSHPMSLSYHKHEMPWGAVLEKAKAFGYRSHSVTTCGLHVHINRSTYGEGESEQDACIARLLFFFERFWDELLIFSRRTPRQLERWAARYGYSEQPQHILKKAKDSRAGRYTAVNLTNTDTVEFRMFRGTLKLNTLIATLELIDRVSDVAISLSDEEIQALSWPTFVAGIDENVYPALVRYLKERRLYVNDIVEDREEES